VDNLPSDKLTWNPRLPDSRDARTFIGEVNELLTDLNRLRSVFEVDLKRYVNEGRIRAFRFVNTRRERSVVYQPIGLIDFDLDHRRDRYWPEIIHRYIKVADLRYSFAISDDSVTLPVASFDFESATSREEFDAHIDRISESNSIISASPPWRITVTSKKRKPQKTQVTLKLLFSLAIDASAFQVRLPSSDNCLHHFRLDSRFGCWKLVWQCLNCGFLCYCDCFREAITISGEIPDHPFYPQACEVCRGVPSTHEYCHEMYARSQFEIRYGAYVRKKAIELAGKHGDWLPPELEQQASNIVREELGFRKIGEGLVTETLLCGIVRAIFPDKNVIHHYRASWLGQQELDVFVSDLNIGVEYQGEQHYISVKAWGGPKALAVAKRRDAAKARRCKQNGVLLVTFSCREKDRLSEEYVLSKMSAAAGRPLKAG
jgi:hypothetical protein